VSDCLTPTDSERSLILGLLTYNEFIAQADSELEQSCFSSPKLGELFAEIVDEMNREGAVSLVTMGDRLQSKGKLETYKDYLNGEEKYQPAKTAIPVLIRKIREASLRRDLMQSLSKLSSATQTGEPIEDIASGLEEAATKLRASRRVECDPKADVMAFIKDLEARERKEVPSILTGIPGVDELIGGFEPGHVCILGAETNIGKSALSIFIMNRLTKEGKKVAYFSLEMSKNEILARMVAERAQVDSELLRQGTFGKVKERVYDAAAEMYNEEPRIYQSFSITLPKMRSECMRLKAEGNLDVAFVDYIQNLQAEGKSSDSRATEIERQIRGIKAMAMELEIVAIVSSQLSRSGMNSNEKRPGLHRLRESGALEQTADQVILLYRKPDCLASDESVMEFWVKKQRCGRNGFTLARFIKEWNMFEPLSPDEHDEYVEQEFGRKKKGGY
jgi:replicative DNA helicase